MNAIKNNAAAHGLRHKAALLLAVLATLTLAVCQLPRTCTMLHEMGSANSDKDVVVRLATPELVSASRMPEVENFPAQYRDLTQAGFDRLVPGDGINVTVWERGGMGVFAVNEAGISDLGNHQIDAKGTLYVPMLGRFKAAGMTLEELHAAVLVRLSKLVVASDVSVTRAG